MSASNNVGSLANLGGGSENLRRREINFRAALRWLHKTMGRASACSAKAAAN